MRASNVDLAAALIANAPFRDVSELAVFEAE